MKKQQFCTVVHRYLNIRSASVDSERVFSDLGYLYSKRRTLLKPVSVDGYLTGGSILRVKRKIAQRETQKRIRFI